MYRTVLVATAVGAAVLTTVATPYTTFATSGDKQDNTKVTICHRTGSATNPYVKITVSSSAAYGGHDDQHDGPVATNTNVAAKLKSQHVEWGDIIPSDATHAGRNWTTEGKAVYDNGCGCIDKSGPIVGPISNKSDDTSESDDCKTTPSKPSTPPAKGGTITPATTPAPTVTTQQTASTPIAPTVTELPHTGIGSSTLIAGSILSLLTGIATYFGRFIRARLMTNL